jgi:electron transport complex protein RnfB
MGGSRMENSSNVYAELQKHLDTMPVGYPATQSGVELRLLKFLFTPEQARIALGLDHRFRTAEQIYQRVKDSGISLEELKTILDEMVDRGNTFLIRKEGEKTYASIPLVVGMLELQGKRLTPDALRDVNEYFQDKFGAEYASSKIPQTRVIPVGKSISSEHRIGTYDELRDIIEKAGDRIRIGECMCRQSMQVAGQPCTVTARKETCMAFRDFADLFAKSGWGRPINKQQALEIAAKNEEDGLVLQPANEQEAQFVCSCCGDCCGILRIAKAMPRPADIVASNYYAQVNKDLCQGCSTCIDRCQMEAIGILDDLAAVNLDRCIGCGLCVSTCPTEAMHLEKKDKETVPPKDMEALYEAIMAHKGIALESHE